MTHPSPLGACFSFLAVVAVVATPDDLVDSSASANASEGNSAQNARAYHNESKVTELADHAFGPIPSALAPIRSLEVVVMVHADFSV